MEQCATHHGSGIEEVLAKCIEALNSVEKLRGTAFCLGAIGAPSSGNTPVLTENSLYGLKFRRPGNDEPFPVGPPCRARLDLEIDGIKVLEVYIAKIAFVTVLLDGSFSKMTSANHFGPKNLQS